MFISCISIISHKHTFWGTLFFSIDHWLFCLLFACDTTMQKSLTARINTWFLACDLPVIGLLSWLFYHLRAKKGPDLICISLVLCIIYLLRCKSVLSQLSCNVKHIQIIVSTDHSFIVWKYLNLSHHVRYCLFKLFIG